MQFAIGFGLSILIAALGYWRSSLSKSGVAGAIILGTVLMGMGGLAWGMILVWFFISASLLSRFKEEQKRATAEKFDKGHQRDWGQAMANAGVGALLVIGWWIWPDPLWFAAYLGAMGTVTADTWATELGTLSKRPPRLITNGRVVAPGTSGGITLLGTAVAAAGGLLTGVLGGVLYTELNWLHGLLVGLAGGLGGALVDSLLGGTVQAIYRSAITGEETEKRIHRGQPTEFLRGWRWFNNDWVNFLASAAGAGIAAGVQLIILNV